MARYGNQTKMGEIKLAKVDFKIGKKIVCKSTNPIVDIDGRLWPCCFMAVGHRGSQYIKKNGKDWNDTNKHSVKEILAHEGFTEHFNDKGWNSDDPDTLCMRECGVVSDKLADKRLNYPDKD